LSESGSKQKIQVRLRSLWIVVSMLWTVATLLRINRVWVPMTGWEGVIEGPWMWMSLLGPPLIFALILVAIHKGTARTIKSSP
jgi:hypothetical protein